VEEDGPDRLVEAGVSEVIRPAAILPEDATRQILRALEAEDARAGGVWDAEPGAWRRYDRPWPDDGGPGDTSQLLGTVWCVYDTPTRFLTTVYRASVTAAGVHQAWTVERLCDEAFGFGGLTLESCPRADLRPPPPTYRG
jgi:hypothetical protein